MDRIGIDVYIFISVLIALMDVYLSVKSFQKNVAGHVPRRLWWTSAI